MLDYRDWTFINGDLTLSLAREPVGAVPDSSRPGQAERAPRNAHGDAAQEWRLPHAARVELAAHLGPAHVERWAERGAGKSALFAADAQRRRANDLVAVCRQARRDELDLLALAQHLDLERERRHRHRPHQIDGEAGHAHRHG